MRKFFGQMGSARDLPNLLVTQLKEHGMATVLNSTLAPATSMASPKSARLVVKTSEQQAEPESELFTREEIALFREDDAQAGRVVGTALCTMFAWSVFILSVVVWWTYRTV